jgi:hypothetical protein
MDPLPGADPGGTSAPPLICKNLWNWPWNLKNWKNLWNWRWILMWSARRGPYPGSAPVYFRLRRPPADERITCNSSLGSLRQKCLCLSVCGGKWLLPPPWISSSQKVSTKQKWRTFRPWVSAHRTEAKIPSFTFSFFCHSLNCIQWHFEKVRKCHPCQPQPLNTAPSTALLWLGCYYEATEVKMAWISWSGWKLW